MPFTQAPVNDTESTKRVTLTREINSRDGGSSGKDEDLVNVFAEIIKNKSAEDNRHFIVKRAGTVKVKDAVSASVMRGMFFWEDQNKLYYAVGTDVYVYNVISGVSATLSAVFGTSSGDVGFTLFLYDDNTSKVVATDGTTLVTIDASNTVQTSVSPDLPSHLPYPVFLDGFLFLAQKNSGDIWNSNLNDPLLYTAGDFITAEMEGDYVLRIAKLNNYLIAMGSTSIEYFWDAGNATGSPLQRNDTPIKLNRFIGGFSQFGNDLFYIGLNDGGQPDVYRLRDFKIESIGTPFISRYLNEATNGIANWRGAIIAFKGHTFYVLNAGTVRTYVFDVETRLWARWAFQANSIFDIRVSAGTISDIAATPYFALGTDNTLYKLSDNIYQDGGVNLTCIITTENNDFGVLNRKTMSRATFLGDRPPDNSTILLQWSDDDYQNFNTGVNVELNQDIACVRRLGSFRQRIFKMSYTQNQNLRLQGIEVDINKGRS